MAGDGFFSNAASKVGKFTVKIKGLIKFFSTFIGQIVFFLLAAILIGILVYIIASVILKDIAKLIGIEGGAQSSASDYAYLNDLASSGYDAMLDANELVEYHAFEYAVLMDAARFLEETGTTELHVANGMPNFDLFFKDDLKEDRMQWAILAAAALMSNSPEADDQASYDSMVAEHIPQLLETENQDQTGGGNSDEASDPDAEFGEGNFTTEYTKENLFYRPVYNQYTGERSLVPYLEMTRDYDIVKYYIEFRDGPVNSTTGSAGPTGGSGNGNTTVSIASNSDFVEYRSKYRSGPNSSPYGNGTNSKGGSTPSEAYNMTSYVQSQGVNLVLGYDMNGEYGNDFLNYFQRQRFTLGDNSENYYGFEASVNFIYNHLYPLEVVKELNVANQSAYPNWDATYDGSGGGQVDLYKEYGASLHYTVQKAPTNHKIPLRILLDRFLPNAVLMSSWRILKDDASTDEDIVNEIQKIYSEACLEGEEFNGEVILVKDVNSVSHGITSNTSAMQLFDKSFAASKIQAKYLDGTYTNTIYNSYAPLFDSRTLVDEGEDAVEVTQPETNGEDTENPTEEEGSSLPAAPQEFGGSLKDDIIDDIKLVLTHYSKESDKSMTEFAYKKVLEDADRLIEVVDNNPISEEQYIIYTPREAGGYYTRCDATSKNGDHYNGENHISRNNPYSASTEIQSCFVPLVKVAYSHKNGFRMTSVIICYEDEYKGYVVKSKEMQDDAKLTNEKTFVHFETRQDVSATTVRHWQFASPSGQATEEKWLVEDAFEGLSLDLGTFSLNLKYTGGPRGGGVAEIELSSDDLNITPERAEELIKLIKINGQDYDESKILKKDNIAIIRQDENNLANSNLEFDPEMLKLPTDPSIGNEYKSQLEAMGYGGFGHTGGESIITDKDFINQKKYGIQAGQSANIDISGVNEELSDLVYDIDTTSALNLVYIYIYKKANDLLPVRLSDANDEALVDLALAYLYSQEFEQWPAYRSQSVTMNNCDEEYAVVMPVRRSIVPIKQDFWDKRIRFYLVKDAAMWSGVKKFNNIITYNGEYRDRGNFMYLISKNKYARGLRGYRVNKAVNYRCKLFAPIFAGNDSANTNARETDILLILSEWLEASEQGLHAADHFIRDLNALINYSKGINYEDGSNVMEPIYNEKGDPYINPGSYTYMYIPDEILKFDDTTSEKAFWLDRLICTPEDPINQETENYLRSKAQTFTWQIVDYELYEECQNEDGTAKVYPLWMFGDQMSRLMYAIASNASDNESLKIEAWGGYAPGMHSAADLFSRNMAKKIYADVFREDKERGSISAEYSAGGVNMSGTDSTPGGSVDIGEHANAFGSMQEEVEIGGGGIYGFGVYDNEAPVTLNLGGKDYTFSGSAAAAYGYELYRYTLLLKDGEKAEKLLKERLEKEIEWPEERAVAPGIVTRVEGSEQGFIVEITHAPQTAEGLDGHVHTSYWHMKRYPLVQIGQYVGAGTLLGYEGTTGQSGTTHVHLDMNVYNASQINPVLYLYPFFTPFYYEEKAIEDGYAIDSDYMSSTRTVFPYGQPMNAHIDESLGVDQTEIDENGWVKIKNYVPTEVFMMDSSYLYDEDSGYEGFIDYSKLPTKNVYRELGAAKYDGEILETNPYYFSEAFIKKVIANGYKIEGVELTWAEKTTYDEYQAGQDSDESSNNNDSEDSDETEGSNETTDTDNVSQPNNGVSNNEHVIN